MPNYNNKEIDNNGTVRYYLNGRLHRTDGPAIERADGGKAWWVNGRLHRTDGPAIERADGYKEWYINGKKYSEQSFNEYIESKKNNCPEYIKFLYKNKKDNRL